MSRLTLLAPLCFALVGLAAPLARCEPAHAGFDFGDPPIEQVQRAALRAAGLEVERLTDHLDRVRWADALPQLRFRVVRDVDRDGRTTVRFSDARWLGDVAAVDTHGEGLRLQGELIWSPGALLGGSDELAALKELRASAKARRALLEAVTAAYFARRRALLDRLEAEDPDAARVAALAVAEQAAVLDGLTGGAFSREAGR